MTDQNSETLDEAVGGMFTMLAEQYQPTADLVPAAIARAQHAIKRRRLTYGIGGGMATAAAEAAVALIATTTSGVGSTASANPSGGAAAALTGSGGASSAAHTGALNPACVGKWLPWTAGSDASQFGRGTDAQRAVVCTEDILALKTILPGATITPYFETFGGGSRAEFTEDQIAQLGPGTDPSTHILKPWQYTVTLNGQSGYFFVSYSAVRTNVCSGCDVSTSQALPGPHGYRLVQQTSPTASQQQRINEDLIETPARTYLGVGVSALSGGDFTPAVDINQLVHDSRFITVLDKDLMELDGN